MSNSRYFTLIIQKPPRNFVSKHLPSQRSSSHVPTNVILRFLFVDTVDYFHKTSAGQVADIEIPLPPRYSFTCNCKGLSVPRLPSVKNATLGELRCKCRPQDRSSNVKHFSKRSWAKLTDFFWSGVDWDGNQTYSILNTTISIEKERRLNKTCPRNMTEWKQGVLHVLVKSLNEMRTEVITKHVFSIWWNHFIDVMFVRKTRDLIEEELATVRGRETKQACKWC